MKKRLLSMLMAVLMIASLVPAVAMADADHTDHDVLTVNIKMDPAKKQPGIVYSYCNTCGEQVGNAKVTPFAALNDICDVHKGTTTKVLQQGNCEQPKITVTYCTKCGTGVVPSTATENSPFVVDDSMTGSHVYTKFEVVKAPTCEMEGWGYTVCDKCGEPEYVYGAGQKDAFTVDPADGKYYYSGDENSAMYYLFYGKDKNAVKTAVVNETFNKFAAKGHDNDNLIVPTKDVYKERWNYNNDGVGLVERYLAYRAKVEATHVQTVSAMAVIDENGKVSKALMDFPMPVDPKATGEGYTGDVYCQYCDYVEKGAVVPSLNNTHSMNLDDAGYMPYMDKEGNKYDGVTDKWSCLTCGKPFGGEKIPYASYFKHEFANENEFYAVTNEAAYGYSLGEIVTVGKVAATCQSEGFTGVKLQVINVNGALTWSVIDGGTVIPKTAHNWTKIESKAATCGMDGWTCTNYYICTNVINGKVCNEVREGGQVAFAERVMPTPTSKVIVEPTCKTKGLTAIVDKYCGDLMCEHENSMLNVDKCFVKVDKVPHMAAAELKGAKEATCTEVGYTGDKVCKWCGIVLEKGKEIPMKEHTVVDVAAVEATCTADGMTAGTKCSVCGTVLSGCEVVKALGHDYKDGKCTRCGEKDPNYVAPVAPEFKDAASIRDYAKDAVAWAAKEGIVKGDDNGNFLPTADITRQDFVTMLWRLKGSVASEKALTFGDKADIKDYAQTAVAWAVENGYIKGRDNGNFDPAAKITRAEIVAILNRIADNAKAEKAADFTDIATHWAKDAIAWAAEAGIVNGVGNNMFAPNDNASRQDTVVMLYKFVNLK